MRIAFLVPSLGRSEGQGGANLELLERIAAAGHRVDVWAGNAPRSVASLPGVRLRALPRLPAWQLGNQLLGLTASSLQLRRRRYDLIHADAGVTFRHADVVTCHTLNDAWLRLPEQLWREPGLRGMHAAAATRLKARLEIGQYRAARAVVANSRKTADDLAARGVDPAAITVVQLGVDAERFRPPTADERAAARARFGLGAEEFVVAFVGAHGPRKGLPEALGALASARAGERMLVAGEHRGGRWIGTANTVMPGKLDDIRPVYWAADVLVYPSRYDAFGMAVLEAMACGSPVIVSREAGAHEIIGDAGFVLPEVSARAIREALDRIRDDGGGRARMGETARAIARTRTWDEAGRNLMRLYEDFAGTPLSRATSPA